MLGRLKNADLRQFLQFAMVGAAATATQYAVLIVLVEAAHVAELPATVVGYLCGAIVNYTLNRRFTFAGTQSSVAKSFAKFWVVNLLGLGLNTAIFATLFQLGAHYLLAQLAATGVGLFWNYFGSRLFVFR